MIVGGMHCSAMDLTVANASNAPAAPIMWPVIDFVPLIASEVGSVAVVGTLAGAMFNASRRAARA